jgi:hypothetical protein
MNIQPAPAAYKAHQTITPASSGTAGDGGWRRWWHRQSEIDGADWVSLLTAARRVLAELHDIHGASSC